MSEAELKAPEADAKECTPVPRPKWENPQWRHRFSLFLSLVIVGIILAISYWFGDSIFGQEEFGWKHLIPYATNLAGILLFILNTSRRKRENWNLRGYWGDYCFRIAESFAYLFIVLWAWNKASSSEAVTTEIGPNIVGFLVGLFIKRVERAMESLGEKFEELLMAVLPRSVQYMTAEEKRRQQLKMVYKIDEAATQYDAIRSQIDSDGAREEIDKLVDSARSAARGEDPDQLAISVEKLSRTVDDVKRTVGEVRVPVEEFLGHLMKKEDKAKEHEDEIAKSEGKKTEGGKDK